MASVQKVNTAALDSLFLWILIYVDDISAIKALLFGKVDVLVVISNHLELNDLLGVLFDVRVFFLLIIVFKRVYTHIACVNTI